MWGPWMLSSKELEQEQVKRVLRESAVLLLHSLRRNRRINLAFIEVLLPGSRPDTWTAGTACVCVSVLHFFSCIAFSAQYCGVFVVCCQLLIGTTRNSVNIRDWTLRRCPLTCGWRHNRGEENFRSGGEGGVVGGGTGPYINFVSVKSARKCEAKILFWLKRLCSWPMLPSTATEHYSHVHAHYCAPLGIWTCLKLNDYWNNQMIAWNRNI